MKTPTSPLSKTADTIARSLCHTWCLIIKAETTHCSTYNPSNSSAYNTMLALEAILAQELGSVVAALAMPGIRHAVDDYDDVIAQMVEAVESQLPHCDCCNTQTDDLVDTDHGQLCETCCIDAVWDL